MLTMYEQITATLRRSIGNAAELCNADQASSLSVCHLLVALLSDHESNAHRIVRKLTREFPKLEVAYKSLEKTLAIPPRAGKPTMSADARAAIQDMIEVGRKLQRARIGTECLLLAIFQKSFDPASRVASLAGTNCATLAESFIGEIGRLEINSET
jgi:ATP-dependent Clp protease ATP-binding subunit ClpA